MDEHKAAAQYILDKMRKVDISGADSEAHSQAKLWLALIIKGDYRVEKVDIDPAAFDGDGYDGHPGFGVGKETGEAKAANGSKEV